MAALLSGLARPVLALDDPESAAESVAATVLTLDGTATVEEDGADKALALGQVLGPGDTVKTGENSSLHLALADGSSVALGPNTEMTLKQLGPGGDGSQSVLQLLRGVLNAMVEKVTPGGKFEVESSNAVAAVKGTDFEVANYSTADTVVTVNEGMVELGDDKRQRFEPILPLRRRRLTNGRLLAEEQLAKRELNEFHERWARAHLFHAQRHELLTHFKTQERGARAKWRKALLKRRALREARQGRGPGKRKARRAEEQEERRERRKKRRVEG
jgi:hypothetical protein